MFSIDFDKDSFNIKNTNTKRNNNTGMFGSVINNY
jgi:hypothetical protein